MVSSKYHPKVGLNISVPQENVTQLFFLLYACMEIGSLSSDGCTGNLLMEEVVCQVCQDTAHLKLFSVLLLLKDHKNLLLGFIRDIKY